MKYVQSITYKLVGESKKIIKSTPNAYFSFDFPVKFVSKKGIFGKMAGSRSFPGKFELYRSKYSRQIPLITPGYGETQAKSYFCRSIHPKSTPQNCQNPARRLKNGPPSGQTVTYQKTEVIQSYLRIWGTYDPIESDLSDPKKWGLYGCSVKKCRFWPILRC